MLLDRRVFALYRAAYPAADRRYINGVSIKPDGSGVATDGSLLVKWTPEFPVDPKEYPHIDGINPVSDEPLTPFTLDLEVCKTLERALRKKTTMPILSYAAVDVTQTNANNFVFMAVTDLESQQLVKPRKVNQTDEKGNEEDAFPKYDRVIPTNDPTVTITFGLDVLKRLIDTLQALDLKSAKFEFRDAESPAVVTGEGEAGKVFALAMPIRTT